MPRPTPCPTLHEAMASGEFIARCHQLSERNRVASEIVRSHYATTGELLSIAALTAEVDRAIASRDLDDAAFWATRNRAACEAAFRGEAA